jgi:hypothetical protein
MDKLGDRPGSNLTYVEATDLATLAGIRVTSIAKGDTFQKD